MALPRRGEPCRLSVEGRARPPVDETLGRGLRIGSIVGEISRALGFALSLAGAEADKLGAAEIDPEDLVLGVLKLHDLVASAPGCPPGVEAETWGEVTAEATTLAAALRTGGIDATRTRRTLRRVLRERRPRTGPFGGHRSARCRTSFELAAIHATERCAASLGLIDILRAVLSQESTYLDEAFAQAGVDRDAFREVLQPGGESHVAEDGRASEAGDTAGASPPEPSGTPMLDALGRDLTALARRGELGPIFGRDAEIRQIAQVLVKRDKPNAVLIGEAGVGKTAVVEGLAQQLVTPAIHPLLADLRVVEISMATLVAGTKYRGDFEARLQSLISEASTHREVILFIDELHTMVGAGAAGGHDAMDAANILKPALGRGDIRVIGATTTAEYRRHIEPSAPLARRFETVLVDEPSPEVTTEILRGMAPGFREHYGVELPDGLLVQTVALTRRYLPERRFPDKAISVLDEACASRVLTTIHVYPGGPAVDEELTLEDVARVISSATGIPVHEMIGDDTDRLLRLYDALRDRVLGQDHAVRAVVDAIQTVKTGVKDTERPKPVASLLFVGATGTGKTELAKALAEELFHDERNLLTFDMTNYREPHKVSDLIGSPPGYVGSDQEGNLTRQVRTHPNSVVLFDEIEKAHPEVLQVLMPVLDEGRLVDNHGRQVSFRDTIVVFTSNLGSDVAQVKQPPGFRVGSDQPRAPLPHVPDPAEPEAPGRWEAYERQVREAISRGLSPNCRTASRTSSSSPPSTGPPSAGSSPGS
jgi:ATP-dependent Clp protease ATP-binding subunit ClpC